jgi:hypothetical protein
MTGGHPGAQLPRLVEQMSVRLTRWRHAAGHPMELLTDSTADRRVGVLRRLETWAGDRSVERPGPAVDLLDRRRSRSAA